MRALDVFKPLDFISALAIISHAFRVLYRLISLIKIQADDFLI